MKNLKQNVLGILILVGCSGIAQEELKHDIGLLITTDNSSRIGIEYRYNFVDKWKIKIGGSYGARNTWPFHQNGEILSVSDSLIEERNRYTFYNWGGLKLGVERQLKESMFAVIADATIQYQQVLSTYNSTFTTLQENGGWQVEPTTIFSPTADPSRGQMKQHFLSPGINTGIRMDIPVKLSLIHI